MFRRPHATGSRSPGLHASPAYRRLHPTRRLPTRTSVTTDTSKPTRRFGMGTLPLRHTRESIETCGKKSHEVTIRAFWTFFWNCHDCIRTFTLISVLCRRVPCPTKRLLTFQRFRSPRCSLLEFLFELRRACLKIIARQFEKVGHHGESGNALVDAAWAPEPTC